MAAAAHLLDVLEHLPVPFLRHLFWPMLQPTAQKALRLTSRRALRLAEQLNGRFLLGFRRPFSKSFWNSPATVKLLGACLGRHEHIEVLTIYTAAPNLPSDADQQLQGSRTACRRVREARVVCENQGSSTNVTQALGQALAASCPALRTVALIGTGGKPAGPFFVGLQASSLHLSEVRTEDVRLKAGLMRSLAALPGLHTLHLVDFVEEAKLANLGDFHSRQAARLTSDNDSSDFSDDSESSDDSTGDPHAAAAPPPGYLLALAGMTQLQALHLGSATLVDPAIFAELTHLRSLVLLTSLSVLSARRGPTRLLVGGIDFGRGGPGEAAMNRVLEHLGALQRLQSLHFSNEGASVDSTGFAGLRQLSQLTRLRVDGLCLAHPGGGLSHLQELHLPHFLSGAELRDSLLACSPSPHLAAVRASVSPDYWEEPSSDADARAPDLDALQAAALHLAAAVAADTSRPPQISLTLQSGQTRFQKDPAAVDAALAALAPLQPCLGRLTLGSLSPAQLAGLWGALAPFEALTQLELVDCKVGMELMDLALHAHTLRRLTVRGREGWQGTVTPSPTLAMAFVAVRQSPIALVWGPLLPESDLRVIQGTIAVLGKAGRISVCEYDPSGESSA